MELLQLPSISLFCAFLFVFMLLKNKLKTNNSALRLPPGPPKLPLIGNLHQLAQGSLPHHTFRKLAKKYGPIMHLQLGQVSTVIISSPETAKEVLKTHDINFASRPPTVATKVLFYDFKDIGFAPYSEYWKQLRKICTMELLSPKRVQFFRPVRETELSNFVTWIASNSGSPINLTNQIFLNAFSITARAAFGKKSNQQEEYISMVKESLKVMAGFNIVDFYPSFKYLEWISGLMPKLLRFREQEDRILGSIINEHKERRKESKEPIDEANKDLVDVLLAYNDDQAEFPLTIDDIKAVIQDIFSAGSDTTATTTDWAMAEMMKNPSTLRKAQDEARQVFRSTRKVDETYLHELKYLKLVIKETLRLHLPGVFLLPRISKERCEINGYEIPATTNVLVNAWAIGRDPKFWTDPECFKPERFINSSIDIRGTDFEYLPFGSGRRICPGMTFGMANVEFTLANLLYHFDWQLANGIKPEEVDMREEFGATVRRKTGLSVIPVPYQPTIAS